MDVPRAALSIQCTGRPKTETIAVTSVDRGYALGLFFAPFTVRANDGSN
jgi:hypothetical protein